MKKFLQHRILLIFLGIAVLIGCGQGNQDAAQQQESEQTNAEEGSVVHDTGEWVTTASGLQYRDIMVGDGEEAITGMTVEVDYLGFLWENGQQGAKFDASTDRGVPLKFTLGAGQVIKGWEEGVAGMNIGGLRQLIIPPDLAWGDQGAGAVIPPNATVDFEVTLLRIISR